MGAVMMGRQTVDQSQLFYLFNLEEHLPADHLLRRLNPIVTRVLVDLREKLAPFYSDIGRPSIDPELMIRMLIVGYCYGIRFERRLCEEVISEARLRSSATITSSSCLLFH
jgi:transposase